MKKLFCILISFIVIFSISANNIAKGNTEDNSEVVRKSIEDKIIRFHVLANSDSAEDQALKLKVRDEVLKFITPKLKDSKSIVNSRNIIKENDKEITSIAAKVIKDNGYNYKVVTELSHENFPVKTYGNITLPQGEYEAYRILIGAAKGQNWWCVMFPPLCFIDITKGEVSYKKTEAVMKKTLTDKEYAMVDNSKTAQESKSEDVKKIQIKFKILEIIKGLLNK